MLFLQAPNSNFYEFWDNNYNFIVGVCSTATIVSAAFSISSFINVHRLEKERFSVMYEYSFVENEEVAIDGGEYRRIAILKFTFSNQSQIPLSLLRLRIITEDTAYDMYPEEYVLADFGRKKGNEIIYQEFRKTSAAPICLSSFSSNSCYIAFMIPTETVSCLKNKLQGAKIEITTNRGHVVQMPLKENEFLEFKSCWIKDVWEKVSRKIHLPKLEK